MLLLMVKLVDDNASIAFVNMSTRMSCNGIQLLGIDFGADSSFRILFSDLILA